MMRSFAELFSRFAARPRAARKLKMAALWSRWDEVFSDPPFDLCRPIGEKSGVLLVGVTDETAMQELSYAKPEILELANAFLGETCFDKVRLELLSNRAPLAAKAPAPVRAQAPPPLPGVGGLRLPHDTAIGRAYAKYAMLAAKQAGRATIDSRRRDHE